MYLCICVFVYLCICVFVYLCIIEFVYLCICVFVYLCSHHHQRMASIVGIGLEQLHSARHHHPLHRHKAFAAHLHQMAVDLHLNAVADFVAGCADRRQRHLTSLGCVDDRTRDRVGLPILRRSRIREQRRFVHLAKNMDMRDRGLVQRQGAGLVKNHGIYLIEQFQRTAIFDQNALLGGQIQIVQHRDRASQTDVETEGRARD